MGCSIASAESVDQLIKRRSPGSKSGVLPEGSSTGNKNRQKSQKRRKDKLGGRKAKKGERETPEVRAIAKQEKIGKNQKNKKFKHFQCRSRKKDRNKAVSSCSESEESIQGVKNHKKWGKSKIFGTARNGKKGVLQARNQRREGRRDTNHLSEQSEDHSDDSEVESSEETEVIYIEDKATQTDDKILWDSFIGLQSLSELKNVQKIPKQGRKGSHPQFTTNPQKTNKTSSNPRPIHPNSRAASSNLSKQLQTHDSPKKPPMFERSPQSAYYTRNRVKMINLNRTVAARYLRGQTLSPMHLAPPQNDIHRPASPMMAKQASYSMKNSQPPTEHDLSGIAHLEMLEKSHEAVDFYEEEQAFINAQSYPSSIQGLDYGLQTPDLSFTNMCQAHEGSKSLLVGSFKFASKGPWSRMRKRNSKILELVGDEDEKSSDGGLGRDLKDSCSSISSSVLSGSDGAKIKILEDEQSLLNKTIAPKDLIVV